MKKIKTKQRIENARNAFFADENSDTNDFLCFRDEANLLQNEKSEGCSRKYNTLETMLKQVLLFFPGTVVLLFLSMGFTVMFVSGFVNPLGIHSRYELIFFTTLFLATTLLTWLGLGDVRKPKHLVIPASVISVGVIFGTIATVLMATSHELARLIFGNNNLVYLLPLALVVPFLAKGWVDRNDEN